MNVVVYFQRISIFYIPRILKILTRKLRSAPHRMPIRLKLPRSRDSYYIINSPSTSVLSIWDHQNSYLWNVKMKFVKLKKKSVWLESDLYMQMKYWHNLIWELQLVNPTVMKCHLCLQGVPPTPQWPAGEYYVQMMTIIYTFANLIVSRVRDVEILLFELWPELLKRIIWREGLCLLYLLDLCLSPRCDIIVIQWIVPRSETLLSPVFDRSV